MKLVFSFEGVKVLLSKDMPSFRLILDSSAVEHPAVNRRVVGSNPTRGANYIFVPQQRGIVQLVERWSPKPNVEGSSPSAPVKFYMAQ